MSIQLNNEFGTIEMSSDVISTVVGGAATEIYGIVGMASRKHVRDGINEILNRDNYSRGVVVRQENDQIAVDVYIIVSYGTKITEVSKNVQERVRYQLEHDLGIVTDSVNVFVQGVRVLNEL
ncbi:putative alkaline-shock protein [Alkalibacterium sp. AK22]|uniref:Asp23/Gls24 family envelope stress response protein n=1 Tax=Alkalibacterium sp. AK22 TaxID=1229520 RepID=UPI0004473EA5|nr:Asp23/Gls24 family envelope stress response protein [Alkalibacterium sp. AK22]EXJ24221.1 putative alkaline-shock protein [Alkalibacterium sp. AK22]